MPTKRTDEEFRKQIKEINPNIIVVGKYTGRNKKIECRCSICDTTWYPVPNSLYTRHGCPRCAGYKRRTQKDFVEEVQESSPNVEVLGDFAGVEKKILCKCKVCGDMFFVHPTVLLRGGGCAACAGNKKKTTESFTVELAEKNQEIEVLGEYINLNTPIKCKCKKCGDIWDAIPKNLLKGHGCALCAKNKKGSTESFVSRMKSLNPNIEIIGTYINNSTPIQCRCTICGKVWESDPQHLLRGQGCPQCYHSSTSFMEKYISEAFAFVLGENEVICRDKEIIGTEIDIYIPSLNLAIEPGSFYWHQKRIEKDYRKQNLAKEKGIRLIIIYDSCKIKNEAKEDIWVYSDELGSDITGRHLRNLVEKLFAEAGINRSLNEDEWNSIAHLAYSKARRKTTERFIQELSSINPHIEVLGKYQKSIARIKCRCKICSYIWTPNTESLLMGHGCPKCAIESNRVRSSKKVLCITTGEVFESITAAAKKYGGHTTSISRCCNGKQKTSCGVEWRYL